MIDGVLARRSRLWLSESLTAEKLALARPDAIVMHPGPMNRGVEIDSSVADGAQDYLIKRQIVPGLLSRAIRYALARQQAESALRAVKRCDPLPMPAQFAPYHQEWKTRILRFDPEEMAG